MRAFQYHVHSIRIVFGELFKGRFLLYFIPGFIIAFAYYAWRLYSLEQIDGLRYEGNNSIIQWFSSGMIMIAEWLFFLTDTLMEQMYIFIVITVLSPFNTSLSEKLDHRLTGHEPDKGWTRLINEFIRMIFIALIALILEGIVLLGYWVFSLGPLGGAHDSIIYFLIKAFFLGFAFFDFSLERYEKNVFQSLGFAFSKPLTMLLTGSIFLGIFEIPYAGIPLAPVLTVMIATVVYLYFIKTLPNKEVKERNG